MVGKGLENTSWKLLYIVLNREVINVEVLSRDIFQYCKQLV